MPKNKPAKLFLRLLCVFVGTLLISLLVVPLFGPGWHLMNGHFIYFEGWKIPVPKTFYVRNSQLGPSLWKQTLGIPLFDVPYGHISLYRPGPTQQPFVHDGDYSRFEKGVTDEASQEGFRLRTKREVVVGRGSGYCLEFAGTASKPRALLRCAIENNPVVVFYEGDPKYVQEVFIMLEGMSLEDASRRLQP